jgi:hypothetical protein
MSHTSILADDSTIHNFISKLHLPLYFSRPAIRHITDFIAGATQKGYREDFATYITQNDAHLVTVNRQSYWVYRYEGALNDMDNAVVLFCWPKDAFLNPKAMRTFLCTDIALDTKTALEYYSRRWPIEIFFRQTKGNLGFNQYQIRQIAGIKRFWALMTLTFLFCAIGISKVASFAKGLSHTRREFKINLVGWIYNQAQAGIPLSQILV